MEKSDRKRGIVVGLTGGIATGKTSVLAEFEKSGARVIACDAIAKEVFYLKEVNDKIRKAFATTDRKKIAAMIFSNPSARRRLEKITHPRIIRELKKRIRAALSGFRGIVAADVPLLYEINIEGVFDRIVVVYCPAEAQKKRLMRREKISSSSALGRIRSQMPMAEKLRRADFVIDNSGDFGDTKKDIKKVLDKLGEI